MFVVVGRFRFRPMARDEWNSRIQGWEQDFSPLARESSGFRGVEFVQLSDDEVMTAWQWERGGLADGTSPVRALPATARHPAFGAGARSR